LRLAAVSLAICLAAAPAFADPNVPIPQTYRLDDYRAPVPDTVPGAEVLHIPEVQRRVAQRDAMLIDVLPAPRRPPSMRPGTPWLPARHPSLPGSVWWPEIGRGALAEAVELRLRQRLQEVTQDDPARLLIFYCLADCWMSWNAARRAGAMGFHAAWFPEGVDGWQAAGLPTQGTLPEAFE
jgi:PQQ-dependent catabolism-associated CXXCW motif protein